MSRKLQQGYLSGSTHTQSPHECVHLHTSYPRKPTHPTHSFYQPAHSRIYYLFSDADKIFRLSETTNYFPCQLQMQGCILNPKCAKVCSRALGFVDDLCFYLQLCLPSTIFNCVILQCPLATSGFNLPQRLQAVSKMNSHRPILK